MSAYRKRWIEVLKDRQIPDWDIDVHGQAIVIKVPVNEDLETISKKAVAAVDALSSEVQIPGEWLKFIFYNEKIRFEYILNPELRELK